MKTTKTKRSLKSNTTNFKHFFAPIYDFNSFYTGDARSSGCASLRLSYDLAEVLISTVGSQDFIELYKQFAKADFSMYTNNNDLDEALLGYWEWCHDCAEMFNRNMRWFMLNDINLAEGEKFTDADAINLLPTMSRQPMATKQVTQLFRYGDGTDSHKIQLLKGYISYLAKRYAKFLEETDRNKRF